MTLLGCSNRPSGNLGDEMQSLVSGLVEKDKSVRDCVLCVTKGDGSFSWSGAAGIAGNQTPMTKDTPVYNERSEGLPNDFCQGKQRAARASGGNAKPGQIVFGR